MIKNNVKILAGTFFIAVVILTPTTIAANVLQSSYVLCHRQSPGYNYQIQWTRIWSDDDWVKTKGKKVATDSNDNAVACVYSGKDDTCFMEKYNSVGNRVFFIPVDINATIVHPYTEENSEPTGNYTMMGRRGDSENGSYFVIKTICTDSQNNIYLISDHYIVENEPPNHEYVCVFKYDQDGNEIWKNAYTTSLLNFMFPGRDSALDSNGNIYIPCWCADGTFLMKIDINGGVLWFKNIKPSFVWFPESVALD